VLQTESLSITKSLDFAKPPNVASETRSARKATANAGCVQTQYNHSKTLLPGYPEHKRLNYGLLAEFIETAQGSRVSLPQQTESISLNPLSAHPYFDPPFGCPVCPSTTMRMLHIARETTWCQMLRQKPLTSPSGNAPGDSCCNHTEKDLGGNTARSWSNSKRR
jgi:hypothetical protein